MNPHAVSSSELIGQAPDAMASADLLAAERSFDLWMRADAIRERAVAVPNYQPQAYLGLMMLGPFCVLSPAIWSSAYNAALNFRANRLERQAAACMPPDVPIILNGNV